MKNHYRLLIILFFATSVACGQNRTIPIFNQVLFYDGYNTLSNLAGQMVSAPAGTLRLRTSLFTHKLTQLQLESFGDYIAMNVTIGAACDNYDRIGNVNLAFVPKNATTYNPDSVQRIEIGRFITPFMNKNISPTSVPYTYDVSYLKYIFTNASLFDVYDVWVELEVFGVPYAANTQVSGCSGRNDVFYGSLEFVTSSPALSLADNRMLIPLFMQYYLTNSAGGTDTIGQTVKSSTFSINTPLSDAQLVLITSNHGANSGGEEYNRRMHYIFFDGDTVLTYKPGRTTCEPFRVYNTQSNGIYGTSVRTPAQWQSFSNWCPGDVIDNRIILFDSLSSGNHTFKITVPSAVFKNGEGYFPLSLYLLGVSDGILSNDNQTQIPFEYVQIYPNPVSSRFLINSSKVVKRVILYHLSGRQVAYSNTNSLDMSGLESGIYGAKIMFEDGSFTVEKIIKD